MKKLATKLTPAIKAWIKEEFGIDYGNQCTRYFHLPKVDGWHACVSLQKGYTEVSEAEFLAEFRKSKPIIQYLYSSREWRDCFHQEQYRIKPTPDYSKEIEALQAKAKENGMSVTVNFEKL